jgi:putative transcriptional regulator
VTARSKSDDVVAADPHDDAPGIQVRLDALLSERGMTLTELSDRVGVTVVNLSVLKNGHARAIRFSTLAGICQALGCQPGDLLRYPVSKTDTEIGMDGDP